MAAFARSRGSLPPSCWPQLLLCPAEGRFWHRPPATAEPSEPPPHSHRHHRALVASPSPSHSLSSLAPEGSGSCSPGIFPQMSFLTPGTRRCIWSGYRLAAPGIALCWELGDRFLQRTQSCSISGGGEEWGQQPAPTGAGADTRSLLSLPSCSSAFAVTCTPQGMLVASEASLCQADTGG